MTRCEVCNNELPKYHSKYCNRVCQHKAQLKVCLGIDEFLIFILPMILIVGAATVGTAFALPPNTTDWNWGTTYPEGYYYNGSGQDGVSGLPPDYELTDDNLEEQEEIEDEKEHEEESKR